MPPRTYVHIPSPTIVHRAPVYVDHQPIYVEHHQPVIVDEKPVVVRRSSSREDVVAAVATVALLAILGLAIYVAGTIPSCHREETCTPLGNGLQDCFQEEVCSTLW